MLQNGAIIPSARCSPAASCLRPRLPMMLSPMVAKLGPPAKDVGVLTCAKRLAAQVLGAKDGAGGHHERLRDQAVHH